MSKTKRKSGRKSSPSGLPPKCDCGETMVAVSCGFLCCRCLGRIKPAISEEIEKIADEYRIQVSRVSNNKLVACRECDGTGEIECEECHGHGEVDCNCGCPNCEGMESCENCDGDGAYDCTACDGTGEVEST